MSNSASAPASDWVPASARVQSTNRKLSTQNLGGDSGPSVLVPLIVSSSLLIWTELTWIKQGKATQNMIETRGIPDSKTRYKRLSEQKVNILKNIICLDKITYKCQVLRCVYFWQKVEIFHLSSWFLNSEMKQKKSIYGQYWKLFLVYKVLKNLGKSHIFPNVYGNIKAPKWCLYLSRNLPLLLW